MKLPLKTPTKTKLDVLKSSKGDSQRISARKRERKSTSLARPQLKYCRAPESPDQLALRIDDDLIPIPSPLTRHVTPPLVTATEAVQYPLPTKLTRHTTAPLVVSPQAVEEVSSGSLSSLTTSDSPNSLVNRDQTGNEVPEQNALEEALTSAKTIR